MPKPKLPDKDFKWTAEFAYVIGLITTDGNLSKDGRHIIMRSSDLQLLKTFKRCLGLTNKIAKTKDNENTTLQIRAKKPSYRIQFGNVQLYRWLLTIGLTARKTYTIGKLKIPDKYFQDFLRGHLDGDGNVRTYTDYYNTYKNPKYIYVRLYTKFTSVSKNHIEWIRENVRRLLSISGHLWERKPQKPNRTSLWELKFAKKDSIKLLSWLYYHPNVPCLKRKRKIAEKFI